jgi:hypothetical protein
MAGREEQECIVLLNLADQDQGFFRFYTSIATRYEWLLRRIRGEGHLYAPPEISKDKWGEITGWSCKVPIRYLSYSSLGIREVSESRVKTARANIGKAKLGPNKRHGMDDSRG